MAFEALLALLAVSGPAERVAAVGRQLVASNADICPVRTMEHACRGTFVLVAGKRPRAGAGAERISVSEGMVAVAGSEDGLAFVLAHELAHIQLSHVPGRAGKAGELAADRAALWLMARAGYDPRVAPEVVRRVGRARGALTITAGGHASPTARRQALRAELDRIAAAGNPGLLRPPMFEPRR